MTIDTLKLACNLAKRGFTQDQAEGLAEELKASVEEGVATKTDLAELKTELYKAMLAQTLVLIGTMVGLKLFG